MLHLVTMDKQVKVTVDLAHLHTPTEAARMLGVSRMTLWRWVKAGKITPVEINHLKLFLSHELNHLLTQRGRSTT